MSQIWQRWKYHVLSDICISDRILNPKVIIDAEYVSKLLEQEHEEALADRALWWLQILYMEKHDHYCNWVAEAKYQEQYIVDIKKAMYQVRSNFVWTGLVISIGTATSKWYEYVEEYQNVQIISIETQKLES